MDAKEKSKLKKILHAMESLVPECNDFHHSKKDQHSHDEDCAPLRRYNDAREMLRDIVEKSDVSPTKQVAPIKTTEYTAFGKTATIPLVVHYRGQQIDSDEWDETLWVERAEDWYALISQKLKNKRVRIIERQKWLGNLK